MAVRRTLKSVTTVRIAHAEPRPGRLADGGFHTRGHLVVLADTVPTKDGGHRAVPVWLQGAGDLEDLLERTADQLFTGVRPQDLTTRLLGAAGAQVTAVDIDLTEADAAELSPEVTVARIAVAGPAGTRQVTADLRLGLALAAAAGAPVRLADAVLDRLAVSVPGDDLLTPFLDRVPPRPALPGRQRWPLVTLSGPRLRYEPRNLDFADGLDRWNLDSWPGPDPDQPEPDQRQPDYMAGTEGPSAVLSSMASRPAGSATLAQAIFADDFRGATVTFSAEIRTESLAGQAGLRLEIFRRWWPQRELPREDHALTIAGWRCQWTRYELTARIPTDADLIRIGIALAGPGQIALRNPDLRVTEPDDGTP
jgi:hypothetical protein